MMQQFLDVKGRASRYFIRDQLSRLGGVGDLAGHEGRRKENAILSTLLYETSNRTGIFVSIEVALV